MDLYQELCGILGEENVFTKEPMSRHTTFRVGGEARCFIRIKSKEQLLKLAEPLMKTNYGKYMKDVADGL